MSHAKGTITAHIARSALNDDPAVRAWVEEWLKARERSRFLATDGASPDEFEKHWRYIRPETVHEGAVEGYEAYLASHAAES